MRCIALICSYFLQRGPCAATMRSVHTHFVSRVNDIPVQTSSPLLPTPTRHLSAKSAKSSPALTCTCRRCQKNSRSALPLHYQTSSVERVICALQNLSCHNIIRAKSVQSWRHTHVRYLRSRPGPWLPQSADWPLAHHCLF